MIFKDESTGYFSSHACSASDRMRREDAHLNSLEREARRTAHKLRGQSTSTIIVNHGKATDAEILAARAAFREGWERGTQPSVTALGRVRIGKRDICTVKSLLGYLAHSQLKPKELKLYRKGIHSRDVRTGERVQVHPYRHVPMKRYTVKRGSEIEWAIDYSWLRSFVSHAVNSTTPLLETSERKPRYSRNGVGSDSKWLVCHCCNTAAPPVPWGEQGYATPQSKQERLRVLIPPPPKERAPWTFYDWRAWLLWYNPLSRNVTGDARRIRVKGVSAVQVALPYNKPIGWNRDSTLTCPELHVHCVCVSREGREHSIRDLRLWYAAHFCQWKRVPHPLYLPTDYDTFKLWDTLHLKGETDPPWENVPKGTADAGAAIFRIREWSDPVRKWFLPLRKKKRR